MQLTASIPKKPSYSYEDYAKLPEGAPYELIGGQLVEEPAPTPYHQKISGRMYGILSKFVKNHKCGEVYYAPIDVYFSNKETYQPDIVFIAKNRLNIIGEKKIEAAPDLVVEILSPSTAYYDLRHKKQVYATHHVQEYWIVDPLEKSIEVYANQNGSFALAESAVNNGLIRSGLLQGWHIELEELFSY